MRQYLTSTRVLVLFHYQHWRISIFTAEVFLPEILHLGYVFFYSRCRSMWEI